MMQYSPSLWHKLTAGVCFSCMVLAAPLAIAQNPPPPMPVGADQQQPAAVVSTEGGEANTAESDEATISLNWQGSLMFPQKDVDDLVTIYRAYLASIAGQNGGETVTSEDEDVAKQTLERLAGIQEEQEIDPEIYNFALNSILYNHSRDWSIWVNGKRHSRKEALEGFKIGTSNVKVSRVGKGQITYVWEPQGTSFEAVQDRWDEKQQRKAAKVQNSQIASGDQVAIDAIGQKVTVTLRPNQTFMSQYMTVMEGTRSLQRTAPSSEPAAAQAADNTLSDADMDIFPEPVTEEMPGGNMEAPAAPMMEDEMSDDMNGNYVDPNQMPVYESGMEPDM